MNFAAYSWNRKSKLLARINKDKMVKINADLHTHTVFSHGKNTPEENVKAALEKGLKKIAITDHAPSHIFYGVRNIGAYLKEIDRLKQKYADRIEVLSGMELNIVSLDGRVEIDEAMRSRLDIAIIGYHKAVLYKDIGSAYHFYLKSRNKTSQDILEINTQSYIHAIEKNRIDFIVHPGYAKPIDHTLLAGYCAKYHVAVEINAKHHDFTAEDLGAYSKAGAKFIISSDAHRKQDVGNFRNSLEFIHETGIAYDQILNIET